ncbi:MAG: threonylcarbamoyl-AMP synthase [Candidatus Doudnabacteria bacterium]|nr:threonylcarbamoyl-AMP synthase [Candidatus Doudnabacteria bacterium]
MRLDIVILPSKSLSEKIGKQNKALEKDAPLVFSVDNKKLFPHITLYHVSVKKENLDQIYQKVQVIAQSTSPFKLLSRRINSEDGVFVLDLKNNSQIYRLHEQVVESLASLRQRSWRNYKGLTGIRKKLVNKYGHRHILKFFRPHITLGKMKDKKNLKKILSQTKIPISSFVADNIAVTEVDNYSQVTRIIKKFKLEPTRLPSQAKFGGQVNRRATSTPKSIRDLQEAVKILKAGGIVVYPTDTSYGLAVDATNVDAVKKLYQLKGRNFKKPIHVIAPLGKSSHTPVYGRKWLDRIVRINPQAKKLIKEFWPGPLTLVLPLKAKWKSWQMLSAGTKNLGIRYPAHKIAQALVESFGKPITTTSANISGKSDTYSVEEVKQQFTKLRLSTDITFLDGGKLPKQQPSTVISLIKDVKILRAGPISRKQILKALK